MELKLVVLAGAKQGLEIPLKKDKFLIGRAKECSLRAGSEAISRRHCAIVRTKSGKWAVRDLGSRNGTYVNGAKIADAVHLKPGDELSVGPLKFNVAERPGEAVAAAPSPAPAASAPEEKPKKKPPVKDVADVVARTIGRSDDSASEDDISKWLLGMPDAASESTLKETLSFQLEDTNAHGHVVAQNGTLTGGDANKQTVEVSVEETAISAPPEADAAPEKKSGGWSLFKKKEGGKEKPAKQKPGKLPPRTEQQTKDSREAAADILREMTRRR